MKASRLQLRQPARRFLRAAIYPEAGILVLTIGLGLTVPEGFGSAIITNQLEMSTENLRGWITDCFEFNWNEPFTVLF